MRRRSKRAPNLSEQTGRIGQELPANQPAPLQPNYAGAGYASSESQPSPAKPVAKTPVAGSDLDAVSRHSGAAADGGTSVGKTVPEGKLVVETQPESPSAVPPEAPSAARPSRGFVVLTIG